MSESNGKPVNTPPNAKYHAIRVYRVETKEPRFVRMLSPAYSGIFTHYHQKRSCYCIGEGCRVPTHAIDRTWKGYAAAEMLAQLFPSVWIPVCLEITEHLELDFRGVYQRGQIWELYQEDTGKPRKNLPITGKLHPDAPPDNLRKPFDFVPCLRALYHRDDIDLRHASPLPARVYVEEVTGNLPLVLTRDKVESLPDNFSFAEDSARRQKEAAESKKSPAERKKERGY